MYKLVQLTLCSHNSYAEKSHFTVWLIVLILSCEHEVATKDLREYNKLQIFCVITRAYRLLGDNNYTKSMSWLYYNENLTTFQWLHSSCGVWYGNGCQYSVCTIYKPHRCRHLNRRDGVWDRLSISIVTSFDASITGDEFDSTLQLPSVRLVAAWHAAYI